jgi:hypothetical protein
MPSGTRTRDWATFDYYALLGIDPSAGADEVTRAFREVAKRSHPDATDDAEAAARFSDVTAAYAVLGDRESRLAYDQVRAEQRATVPNVRVAPPVARTTSKRKPWSARKSLTVLLVGIVVALLGSGAGLLTWSMHEHDARQRARFVPVVATRGDGVSGSLVSFLTREGERIRVPQPEQHGDPAGHSLTVNIRYDPADPEHVIPDTGTFGRDITFTIVAVKLLIGGLFLAVTGWRRLRRATAAR